MPATSIRPTIAIQLHVQGTAEGGWGHRLTALLVIPHLLAVLPNGIALSLVMVQRASMGGAAPAPFTPYASDVISGGVMGLTVLAVAGCAAPWFAHACRPYLGVSPCFGLDLPLCRRWLSRGARG